MIILNSRIWNEFKRLNISLVRKVWTIWLSILKLDLSELFYYLMLPALVSSESFFNLAAILSDYDTRIAVMYPFIFLSFIM